ncbi:hypothetical protein, partial [Aidingimonas halophila]|uniref:hypothetical protein n=1 Tax=Aidingimonas halophila TaxID=574349 RepID=UPI001E53C2C0
PKLEHRVGKAGDDQHFCHCDYPKIAARCRVTDERIAYGSYPLLAARELLQQFIREQVHGHQAVPIGRVAPSRRVTRVAVFSHWASMWCASDVKALCQRCYPQL